VIAAVMLAAGLARRMGRQKLLLQLQGKPVVRWSVEHIVSHVEDVVVVTGPDDTAIRQALEDLTVRFAVNPRPQDGQGTSIAAGIAALKPWTTAALVALGDQPRMPATVVPRCSKPSALGQGHRRAGLPGRAGHAGRVLVGGVRRAPRAQGRRGRAGVVKENPERVETVAFDLAMPPDVDTPEDYAKLHVQ
jgi:molybdenum cofactor cytidylyltransferase